MNQQSEQLKAQHNTEIQGLKDQTGQLTNQRNIAKAEIKHAIEVADLVSQLEEDKEYQASYVFFKLIFQEFKDKAIACNESFKKTQISFFQGLNQIQ